MDPLDDEVFAVLVAIVVVASVFAVAQEFRHIELFNAIGLLNIEGKIGDYPSFVLIGENLSLIVYVFNYMGRPEAFKVIYRFGSMDMLPTNSTPSHAPELWSRIVVLNHGKEALINASIPIPMDPNLIGGRATLIFELWIYDTNNNEWTYTGRWVHLHVDVVGVPP